MHTENRISILGCGWLGLPLAARFIQEGYRVKGSTTSVAKVQLLADMGINPCLIDLKDSPSQQELAAFTDTDVLIISFPPGLRAGNGDAYLQQIRHLAQALQQGATPNILFVSSTAVYPDLNRVVTEADDDLIDKTGNVLWEAESLLSALPGKAFTTVRLAGLAGANRHPGRFLAGKTNLSNPRGPVNLVHQADAVEILFQVVRQQKWQERFNACSDEHPSREDYYTAAAGSLDLPPPHFAAPTPLDSYKIISNAKVRQVLNYVFQYPDPRLFF
jgi:nucleoside-diphosphate-sugar epimerase